MHLLFVCLQVRGLVEGSLTNITREGSLACMGDFMNVKACSFREILSTHFTGKSKHTRVFFRIMVELVFLKSLQSFERATAMAAFKIATFKVFFQYASSFQL